MGRDKDELFQMALQPYNFQKSYEHPDSYDYLANLT